MKIEIYKIKPMKILPFITMVFLVFINLNSFAQPNWAEIKSNATFIVEDPTYLTPQIQPLNVGGWEDGLYITRDGKHLFSTYLPVDAFSWLYDLVLDPFCFDFTPYYRGPLLDIDTVTNILGCEHYMQSDIVIASKTDILAPFINWESSNLQTSFSFEGGAQGVLLDENTFDVFVYTVDGPESEGVDLMFMKNVPINPTTETAVPILVSEGAEDNPHIERLNDSTLILLFDRDRSIYYSHSYDNGDNWEAPTLITNVLNDDAPFDVQPHLWQDGDNWWVYFCATNDFGVRCIYKSKQLIANDWDSWDEKELVITPGHIEGEYGTIFAIGEPTLTTWGDLSFVVVYGNNSLDDSTDVYDCDPWILYKRDSPLLGINKKTSLQKELNVFPNPFTDFTTIQFSEELTGKNQLIIRDIQGKKVFQAVNITGNEYIFRNNGLEAGIYLLSVVQEDKLIYNTKLIAA
ncbi:T9SS type A sorting domain-containing protein [Crocinitomix catalasitica]|uniref:T9SS type A sorting domain-containing protein n=1 Tax=Crocinitomix catalasitica TaxID=184607 RepID=UPI001B8018F1|nr:T9SS type A sorting domain-containing protein [Crocinitomix catalasitica]